MREIKLRFKDLDLRKITNKDIQKLVEQLNDKEQFKFELSKATTRKIATIDTHWLKKDGYRIPDRFHKVASTIAVKLKRKQDKDLINIKLKQLQNEK